MFKRILSLIICVLTLVSSFASTGVFASANTEIADEILSQAQAEPTEEPTEESSVSAPELPIATADRNSSVVVPDTATATYSGTCGDNITWTLDTSTGVINITGIGDMYDYKSKYITDSWLSDAPWVPYYSYITAVTIGDGVASIGDRAFVGCDSLVNVTISDSVADIGNYAFCGCAELTNIFIPETIVNLGVRAFGLCEKLTSVYVAAQNIGEGAFYYCNAIESITLGGTVSTIGNMAFDGCRSVKSIFIPASVSSLASNTFGGFSCFESFVVDSDNPYFTSEDGVIYTEDMSVLIKYPMGNTRTNFVIPDSVTTLARDSFACSESLENVVIPDSVTTIDDDAFCCSGITSISIPDSVTSVGVCAFSSCDDLVSVKLSNSVTRIEGETFWGCLSLKNISIPDSVTSVGIDAFYYCSELESVHIGNSVTDIGDGAFSYCNSLKSVTIPDSVISIGNNAFHYYDNGYKPIDLTIKCYDNSYAHTYAVNEGFKYELICDHIFTNYISDNNATCTEDGTKTAVCNNGCGTTDTIIDESTALGHIWSEWIIISESTYTTEGLQIRYCTVCLFGEEEAIPKLDPPFDENKPIITVDNFTVTITNADNIKDMRYALGVYSTTTEIRNAEGNVALSAALVVKNTVDGNFVYTMPSGGMYSIWIRMKDGTNYILPLDVTKIDASVSTYGVKVTIHDIFDIKDIYIAKGEYQTYREIKDNGYIVALSANKIGGKHDYTYTVYEPGVHTVLIRYNDGRTALFHETLTVDEPVFTTNGLQITVSNIPDVKVIRTAYGEYNTPGDTKRAEGARNFSGKSVIKDANDYTIQYRENGMVTVIVEYNNGYVKIFHHEIQKKTATMIQTPSVIMFKDLDDFVMIRYAMGEYTASSQIKAAKGSKVIKPADLTGGNAIISGLAKGTYTFCVQFDDESYNYFKVVIE